VQNVNALLASIAREALHILVLRVVHMNRYHERLHRRQRRFLRRAVCRPEGLGIMVNIWILSFLMAAPPT
jgi:hypothetical protein